ncbi:MAG: biotin/lipoyl-binding protein [Pyrinomonadaceae bacterium]|nr:biotin/lipoyl-binding protein [Pyrinomonadaceae bacterium]
MKRIAKINGKELSVEIKIDGSSVRAEIDQNTIEAEFSRPEPGLVKFMIGNRVVEAFVAPDGRAVTIGGKTFDVELIDPRRLRAAGSGQQTADGTAEIKTAMPGKVVRVIAEAGSEVAAGDGVIVVEAMKMQNELKSPKDGTVREIRFNEGDNVATGDVLAVID